MPPEHGGKQCGAQVAYLRKGTEIESFGLVNHVCLPGEPRAGVSAGSRDLEDSGGCLKTPRVALSLTRGAAATAARYI